MRCVLFVYTLIAFTLASPVPDLETRGGYGGYPIFFGGIGAPATSGNSGNANGGSVENVATSPWGPVSNSWGSGKLHRFGLMHNVLT